MRCVLSTSRSAILARFAVLWAVGSLALPLPAQLVQSIDAPGPSRPSDVTVDATVVLVNGIPLFARVVQHNGEPFEFLQAIGFNAVQLPATATDEQLATARRLGLWLVCPPPASVGLERIPSRFDPVLAWSVAENASSRDLQLIRETCREIQASDSRTGRPVMASVDSHWSAIGEMVDIVTTGTETIGSNFPARNYSDWILQKTTSQMQPFWIDIPTEFSSDFMEQVVSLTGREVTLPIEPQQLEFLAYEVIAGGGRGIRFLSRSRLDGNDPYSRLRALTLRGLLRHLNQIELWAAAGLAQQVQLPGLEQLELHEIRMPDSRLLLIQRPTDLEQMTAGDPPLKSIRLSGLTTGVSDQAYLVNESGTELISDQRSATGLRLEIDACPFQSCLLITSNPLVLSQMNRISNQYRDISSLDLRLSLTRQWFALMQSVQQALDVTGNGGPLLAGRMQQVDTDLADAQASLTSGNVPLAIDKLNQADARLATLRRRLLETQLGTPNGLLTTPLLSHFVLIPDHLQLANRLANSNWNPNSLTAGDFENLEQMTRAGWINHREEKESAITTVELSRSAAVDGSYGLRMTVAARGITAQPVQANPVWIRSGEVAVTAGQLIRIHGWVNVTASIEGSQHGLTIQDSLGSSEMALNVQRTDGWQEFIMYRSVPRTGGLTVTFALTGYGSAMIDEVTIRTLNPQPRTTEAEPEDRQLR